MIVDAFFTYLPLVLCVYHLRGLTRRSVYHSNQIIRIVLCFIVSNILKLYFRVERPCDDNRGYIRGIIDGTIYVFTSNYAFPSTHSVFYTQYFMYSMSVLTFLIGLFGIFTRIFYNHHTPAQVFFGLCFALLMEISLLNRFKLRKKSVIESNWVKYKMKQNKDYSAKMLKTMNICAHNKL